MKLNTGKVWSEATRMIGANRDLVVVLAGIFFFVPLMVMLVSLFGTDFSFGGPDAEPNPELISAQINTLILNYWWAIALVSLGQIAGAIALLGLLGGRDKPTVGEAMAAIPKLLLTMIAAQLLTALATQALPLIAGVLPEAVGSIVNLLLLPVTIYIGVKLSLTSAVVVIERQMNPIAALKRSWQLTKGNTLAIFLFYLLLVIAAMVIGLVVALTLGLVLALLGERIQLVGNAAVLSGLIAGYYALSYAVTAAIHTQLAGPQGEVIARTFD